MIKIKVCGMKYPENIAELMKLPIDYMGLIFHTQSPRSFLRPDEGIFNLLSPIVDELNVDLNSVPSHIKRVGVMVNEMPNLALSYIKEFKLDCIQLHGTEDAKYCRNIREEYPDIEIIKAVNVSEPSDFAKAEDLNDYCDYFLFDTKTPQHGGSGKKFDWSILKSYNGSKPFFLSGGISTDDVAAIKMIDHPQLYALDLNSRFEIEPGLKDIKRLEKFINDIQL